MLLSGSYVTDDGSIIFNDIYSDFLALYNYCVSSVFISTNL